MRTKFLTILLSVFVLTCGAAFGQSSITLDTVLGYNNDLGVDAIYTNGTDPIVFHIRITNDATTNGGVTNGFRIYSDDGAVWDTTYGDTVNGTWMDWFDLNYAINVFDGGDGKGSGADTVGFIGSRLFATGLPANFDDVAYTITIGPIAVEQRNKTICIDSAFFPPSGFWKWADPDETPSWDGPHCFRVVDDVALDVVTLNGAGLPSTFALAQNYPNPFNPTTKIEFDVPRKSEVKISVFNVLGQNIKTLVNEVVDAGVHQVEWDGTNNGGSQVASGIYFYRLETEDFTATKKMMMLK